MSWYLKFGLSLWMMTLSLRVLFIGELSSAKFGGATVYGLQAYLVGVLMTLMSATMVRVLIREKFRKSDTNS